MIETLYNVLGNAPMVGQPITTAYISNRIKKAVQAAKDKKLDTETAQLVGDQLDSALQDKANDIFDSEIGPIISKHNIPDHVIKPLKEKAIEQLVGVLKEKIVNKITTKQA
ncbi:MAG: hypothetical protein NZ529_00580 [Cytophagaceae bacterium]|nr:hypothetical protein [Cytophagaceae bacterium]MDW8455259.1 hypothetical protein [Cytophagaceae bacterium]